LLEDADAASRPTESVLELRLEKIIGQLPGLVRQHEVFDRDGAFIARVDFAIPSHKIAIEAHSRRYHFGRGAVSDDARREAALHAEGWIVRYVTARDLGEPKALLRSIVALVEARTR
jgi:very-short-patch-repair endonuclease